MARYKWPYIKAAGNIEVSPALHRALTGPGYSVLHFNEVESSIEPGRRCTDRPGAAEIIKTRRFEK
jgi:hypothetical protein